MTSPLTLYSSPRSACSKEDFPDPTLPTTQVSSPLDAEKFMSSSACLSSYRFHENVPSMIRNDSSPSCSAGGSMVKASGCSSSAVKNAVKRPTATEASIIDVMTIGRIASGKVNKLNNVSAGN